MKRCLGLAVLCLVCLSAFWGCGGGAPPDYLAFQRESFVAEVQGRIAGRAFGAEIGVEVSGETRRVTVEYLAPEALKGVRITALCNAEGIPGGDCEITCGEIALTWDAIGFGGLLAPASCLLALSEPATVQREKETYTLTFSDGVTLILDANGNPRSLASQEMELDIVWREIRR